jgi:hypothetical protein
VFCDCVHCAETEELDDAVLPFADFRYGRGGEALGWTEASALVTLRAKSNPITRAERLAAGVAVGANYEAYQRANNNNNKQKEL